MAEELLKKHKRAIEELRLVPSDGGVFEVVKNGKLIFSKRQVKRFPEDGEVAAILSGNREPALGDPPS
ncbi:MAG: selenoprotein [Myxococcales bacterium]|nr:selenoprotein [Myxococcales bacterium]MCB9896840.1 selenoprotein [Planctomycetota bacterium]